MIIFSQKNHQKLKIHIWIKSTALCNWGTEHSLEICGVGAKNGGQKVFFSSPLLIIASTHLDWTKKPKFRSPFSLCSGWPKEVLHISHLNLSLNNQGSLRESSRGGQAHKNLKGQKIRQLKVNLQFDYSRVVPSFSFGNKYSAVSLVITPRSHSHI